MDDRIGLAQALLTWAKMFPTGSERQRMALLAARDVIEIAVEDAGKDIPGKVMKRKLLKIGDEDFMPNAEVAALYAARRGPINGDNDE